MLGTIVPIRYKVDESGRVFMEFHSQHSSWQMALDQYRAVERDYRAFLKLEYQPKRSALFGSGDIEALQQLESARLDRLSDRFEHMYVLVGVPAPDLAAFMIKLEIAYREAFCDAPDLTQLFVQLLADARRLIPAA